MCFMVIDGQKCGILGGCGKVDVAFCSFYSVSFIILMPISILVRFVSFFTTSL